MEDICVGVAVVDSQNEDGHMQSKTAQLIQSTVINYALPWLYKLHIRNVAISLTLKLQLD